MATYDIQPQTPNALQDGPVPDKKKKKKDEPVPEGLPSPKEPTAASAVVPAGSSGAYMVMPVGVSGDVQGQTRPRLATAGTSPMGDTNEPGMPPGVETQPVDSTPMLDSYKQKLEALHKAETDPVQKEKWYKALLKMGAYGMSQMPVGDTWSDVAKQIGGFGGGAISGVVQPKLPGAVQKMYNIQKAQGDVATAEKGANIESQMQRRGELTNQGWVARGQAQQRILNNQEKTSTEKRYKNWLMASGDKKQDTAEKRLEFLKTMGLRTAEDREKYQNWAMDIGNEKFGETKRHNRVEEKLSTDRNNLTAQRNAIYQQSVNQTGDKIKATTQADAFIVDKLKEQSAQYENMIEALDPTDDAQEINKLQAAIIANNKEIAKSSSKAEGAGVSPNAGTAPSKNAPSTDQLKAMSETEAQAFINSVKGLTNKERESYLKRWRKLKAGK